MTLYLHIPVWLIWAGAAAVALAWLAIGVIGWACGWNEGTKQL